jgi:hypothetical protein
VPRSSCPRLCHNQPKAAWCAEGKCKCPRWNNPKWFGQAHHTQEVAAKARDWAVKEHKLPKATHPPLATLTPPAGRSGPSSTPRTVTKATYGDLAP